MVGTLTLIYMFIIIIITFFIAIHYHYHLKYFLSITTVFSIEIFAILLYTKKCLVSIVFNPSI